MTVAHWLDTNRGVIGDLGRKKVFHKHLKPSGGMLILISTLSSVYLWIRYIEAHSNDRWIFVYVLFVLGLLTVCAHFLAWITVTDQTERFQKKKDEEISTRLELARIMDPQHVVTLEDILYFHPNRCRFCGSDKINERTVRHEVDKSWSVAGMTSHIIDIEHIETVERQCIACNSYLRKVDRTEPKSYGFEGTEWRPCQIRTSYARYESYIDIAILREKMDEGIRNIVK